MPEKGTSRREVGKGCGGIPPFMGCLGGGLGGSSKKEASGVSLSGNIVSLCKWKYCVSLCK